MTLEITAAAPNVLHLKYDTHAFGFAFPTKTMCSRRTSAFYLF